jgi:endonuclease/exonuclease/phosphatase (EEP) superfamily protein YafD
LVACSPISYLQGSSGQANHVAQSASEASQCRELLNRPIRETVAKLDPANIRLFNWNIQKGKQLGWKSDLYSMASDSQLVLMQEAVLDSEMVNPERLAAYWSFAPGTRQKDTLTGVLTMSSIEPLTHCNLTDWEPWLRTPKATSITEYALNGTDVSLVVVNIHAVNFTLGVESYGRQFERIFTILRDHDGPLIVSGDFNSWHRGREELLQSLVDRLKLTALVYREDQRVQVFGRPIDHIYIRGLQALAASSTVVNSSDHNPITVKLSVKEDNL